MQTKTATVTLYAAYAADDFGKETSGHGYWVSFNLPRGERKPRGFDAATKSVHVALTPESKR
jgi:hypothetical protein